MTARAVIVGGLLGCAIAAVGYFNDWILQGVFLATNLAPVSVYGVLVLGLLGLNPLLRLLRCRPFRGGEWAVIVGMSLVACVVPGPGLMWHLSNTLVMPHYYNNVNPGWQSAGVMAYAPPRALVDSADFQRVVLDFRSGTGGAVSPANVPWQAWSGPLTLWMPLLAVTFLGAIGVVLATYRQWSAREHLRYPIAEVARELLAGAEGSYWPPIFHNGRFWMGLGLAAGVLVVNGYAVWNPGSVSIPLNLSLIQIARKWPILGSVPEGWRLFRPEVFFSAVGLAYLLGNEVSLSLGISNLLFAAVFLALLGAGVPMSQDFLETGPHSQQMFGSYVGALLMILYVGRRHYGSLVLRSVGSSRGDPVDAGALWGFRLAVAAAVAAVAMLSLGLRVSWPVAAAFVGLLAMMWIVLTRIHVETGLFMIQPGWQGAGVLLGLLGFSALGPHMLLTLALASTVLTVDPIVCLMPLAANALGTGQRLGVSPGKLGAWLGVAALAALAVGVPATLSVQYAHGGGNHYGWANTTARMPFELLARHLPSWSGQPADSPRLDLAALRPKGGFGWFVGAGLVLTLAATALRLRFRWWPIHPVVFLVWGTFPLAVLGPSFLLGWLVKRLIMSYGGIDSYQGWKPLFVGLVAGEFAAAILWMLVSVFYYLSTGVLGPAFRVIPA